MAKKRSGSSKEKSESTPSVSTGCVSGKRNGICQGSPRSSLKATTRSAKRDLKSIRVPSQKSPADIDEEKSTRRHSCIGKKRNSLHQELNKSPSKKLKIDTLHQVHVLKEEAAKTKELDKHSSLRGKRKKAGQSKQPHNDKAEETLKPQTDSIELMAEKHQLKQKSPLKHINVHEATPEDLQGSQRKHKIVSKKLKLDLVANVEEDFTAENDAGSSSGESSDEENVAWEEVDEAHVADHRLEIGGDETEASTSHKQHSSSKKSVEISITVPGTKKGKKGWNQEDMMKYVKRAVTRFRKEVSTNVHKVHLLTLVAHGIFRNSVCNDPVHQAVLLSHVPNDFVSGNKRKWDVAQLSNFLKWFQSEFTNTDDVGTGEKEADEQISKLQNLSEVLVIVLRALGFLARLVYSMQPMSTKGNLESKLSPKNSKKNTLKESKTTVKNTSETPTQPRKQKAAIKKELVKTEDEVITPSSEPVKNTSEEILKTPTQPRKQKAAIKKELVKTENEVITPSSKPVKKTPEESSKTPTQPKKRKAATKKKVVKTENEITTPSSTPVKNTSEDILKTSTQPRKQKAVMKNEIVKTENEVTTPSRKPVIYSSDKGSGELYEEKLQKSKKSESSANCAVKTPKRRTRQVDKVIAEDMDHAGSGKKNMTKNKRPLRKRKKVDYSLCGTDDRSDADKERNDESSDSEESSEEIYVAQENLKTRSKTPLAWKKKSTGSQSIVDLVDDDSDFEVTSKPLVRRRTSAGSSERKKKGFKMVNYSDESDESVKCLGYVSNEQDSNWWAEVYLPVDKKWICLHLESSSINHPELCETQATQPLVYVVAFDNKNSIKDVTNRYASSWMSKTRKLRIDSDWWEDTLRPYKSKNKKMTEMEDSHLEDQLLDKPLPTSITEYKNHPLYALKRHLLKFEAIYPETATILGYCRSELHTREKWLNEALVVTQGENAYKIVKGRAKKNQPIHERDSVTIDLFGRWQTEKYKPPPAKDGKVPRNEYGNVELFQPCMLPPGTKHIQVNGILRVAKKLGIDCAQAVVGFDFHCGFSHPVIDGVVVCEEFERVLLDAWKEEEEQAEKRKAEKREKRMLANWRLLTRSLLIRERLRKRYDTEETNMAETSSNCEEEMTTDTSIAWPLNRQEGKSSVASDGHCHVFPTSGHRQDSVTGEWTKSCSCGLTLPFEKM